MFECALQMVSSSGAGGLLTVHLGFRHALEHCAGPEVRTPRISIRKTAAQGADRVGRVRTWWLMMIDVGNPASLPNPDASLILGVIPHRGGDTRQAAGRLFAPVRQKRVSLSCWVPLLVLGYLSNTASFCFMCLSWCRGPQSFANVSQWQRQKPARGVLGALASRGER